VKRDGSSVDNVSGDANATKVVAARAIAVTVDFIFAERLSAPTGAVEGKMEGD
jgi:hypothetical protein